ncbi:LamG-like jellyroll fold domain-containing protein [Fodinicola acaciae]|uniref:LamG-like jellyroll fold domain-containing protein n=1 Tax=Fodinicola acaciae TaxID=2681555 RepID=UPI0013D3DB96|nr:LamG-like jellyroll fold domain-containing protein [Fodinicola acaciae]
MKRPSRALLVAAALGLVTALAVPVTPADAARPAATVRPHVTPRGTLSPDAVARINDAVNNTSDQWGNELVNAPNGPSLAAVRPLLPPVTNAGPGHSASGYYYLPMTYPKPTAATWQATRAFALQVADGSQILSNYSEGAATQTVSFGVGADGNEAYGSQQAHLADPQLAGGYLPILVNSYTDGTGTRFDRESYAIRVGSDTGPLVSFVKFTVHPGNSATTLRLNLNNPQIGGIGVSGNTLSANGQSYVKFSGSPSWSSPNLSYGIDPSAGVQDIYLIVANTPANLSSVGADATGYANARQQVSSYWQNVLSGGATINVPEAYAQNAMRNLLLQDLVMAFQQSIGDGYESPASDFAFVPELDSSVSTLGEFGYDTDFRQDLSALLVRGQGDGAFPDWEKGFKLQEAASYYFLTNDSSYISQNLNTFTGWLTGAGGFQAQMAANNNLVEKEQYVSDIATPVYGLNHQSQVWRGMRDFAIALRQMGNTSLADQFAAQATTLRTAILSAVRQSETKLSDGSIFVPIPLLDPSEKQPFEPITGSRFGSYWNIIIPYALGTGIFPAGSPEATGIATYIRNHGGLFLGMTRFNLYGGDAGNCEVDAPLNFPANAPGYKTTGVDQQYGFGWTKYLSDQGDAGGLNMQFYGQLGQELAPNTFIGGEGATLSPCPGEYDRSMFFPPLAAGNAVPLQAMRGMLVSEGLADDGTPRTLNIAPATPQQWLSDGQNVSVGKLPTDFGPLTYSIASQLSQGKVTASITPPAAAPGRLKPTDVVLHLRTPAGSRLSGVTVNGASHAFDATAQTVDLGAISANVTVLAQYSSAAVGANQAVPTVLSAAPDVVRPGQGLPVSGTVEAVGSGTVTGTVAVSAPTGWTVPSPAGFSVASSGSIGWQKFQTFVQPPPNTPAGTYQVTVTTTPSGGSPVSRALSVTVATPSTSDYASLVELDHPTAYWRLDDTGSTAVDSSPYHTNGTYQAGSVTSSSGPFAGDTAVCLNGNGYMSVPNSLAVSPSAATSWEAWVKVNTTQQQSIVEKYDGPHYNGFGVRLITGNKLQAFMLDRSDTLPPAITSTRSVQTGQWYHVAVSYDGTTMVLYLNGQPVGSVASPAPTLGSNSLKIGARGDDAGTRLNGCVSQVAIYDHALASATVRAHYLRGILQAGGGAEGSQAMVLQSQQQHFFGTTASGNAEHWFWEPSNNTILHDVWASGVTGVPTAGLADTGQQHLWARGTDGSIRHAYWTPSDNTIRQDTWAPSGSVAADPASAIVGSQLHVFGIDPNGTLQHWWKDEKQGSVTHDTWTGGVALTGRPTVLVDDNGTIHVFGRGTDGSLQHLWETLATGTVQHDAWAPAGSIAADPVARTIGHQEHVFAVDAAHGLQHWSVEQGQATPGHNTWATDAGLAGRPTIMVDDTGAQHVMVRGGDGSLQHFWWTPADNTIRHDTWAPAGSIGADPTAMFINRQQHVWAVDGSGHVQHWFWDENTNQLNHDDWTARATAAGSSKRH